MLPRPRLPVGPARSTARLNWALCVPAVAATGRPRSGPSRTAARCRRLRGSDPDRREPGTFRAPSARETAIAIGSDGREPSWSTVASGPVVAGGTPTRGRCDYVQAAGRPFRKGGVRRVRVAHAVVETTLDHLEGQEVLPLLSQDPAKAVDVRLVELTVTGWRPLRDEQAPALEETDL